MSYEYSDTQNILNSLARSHQSDEEKISLKIAAKSVNSDLPPLASFNLLFLLPELFLKCPLNIYGNMAVIGSIIQSGFEISVFN
jgi:hypothetical protein